MGSSPCQTDPPQLLSLIPGRDYSSLIFADLTLATSRVPGVLGGLIWACGAENNCHCLLPPPFVSISPGENVSGQCALGLEVFLQWDWFCLVILSGQGGQAGMLLRAHQGLPSLSTPTVHVLACEHRNSVSGKALFPVGGTDYPQLTYRVHGVRSLRLILAKRLSSDKVQI